MGSSAARVARLAAVGAALGAAACGDNGGRPDAGGADGRPLPADAAVPAVAEAADCGGLAMRTRTGTPLYVSHIQLAVPPDQVLDLDGDQQPDNALESLGLQFDSLARSYLEAGFLAIPVELFDRGDAPDPCVKLGWYRGTCRDHRCEFTDELPDHVMLDPDTIDGEGPVSRLRAMAVRGDGTLEATGPGYLELAVPIAQPEVPRPFQDLIFPISVSYAKGTLTSIGIAGLHLGGFVQAFRMDQLAAPVHPTLRLFEGDTVLDAMYANPVGRRLVFQVGRDGCTVAASDLDGDGLERFCDTRPHDRVHRIDLCIDGDGTEVRDGENGVAECSQALKHGVPRFVDGFSAQAILSARYGIPFE